MSDEKTKAPDETKSKSSPQEALPILQVAPSPHVFHEGPTTRGMMRDVIVALVPIILAAIYFFRKTTIINFWKNIIFTIFKNNDIFITKLYTYFFKFIR